MNKLYLLCLTTLLAIMSVPAGAVNRSNPIATEEFELAIEDAKDEISKRSRVEKRAKKLEIKNAIREYRQKATDTNTLLLVIITILLPPLGMYLHEGKITDRFWISLLLTLLFYIPGLIYTLIVILGER
jgi:uncharacterized membrane protein YqaE (UPF0057 family)